MLKESALRALKTLLPKGQVFTDRATLVTYEGDAGLDKGIPDGVVFPRNTAEVMRIVRWAAEYRVHLIARGAGTGLSGGAVAEQGGVIVEFSHMNRILDIDIQGRSAVVEPALINLRLDEQVQPHGLYFPPDPSSQRASTIGGNVAENSGGPHCFKYGVTTNYVTGLDVVLADGRRIHAGGRARDYPEYDLCGLITGSEGMLCLMTAITVRLVRTPPAIKTLLAVFDSIEQAGEAVSAVISAGLVPATMEMMDQQSVRIVEPFAHAGLPLDAGAVLIIEIDGYPESLDGQMEEVCHVLEQHGGYGMRIAQDEEERAKIWLARKSVGGAIAHISAGGNYTMDITVPRSLLAKMLAEANEICQRHDLRVTHVFHAGDGNLHPLILITEPDNPEQLKRVHAASYELVQRCAEVGGSLTGEHGVGIEKRELMPLMHNAAELLALWDVKQAFDPNNIFNPGKIFPLPTNNNTDHSTSHVARRDNPQDVHTSQNAILDAAIYTPTTAEDVAHYLRACTGAGRKLAITGVSHPQDRQQAHYLNTSALSGVLTYAPDDLYITVGAGTLLTEVQAFLEQRGKQLAVASPWPDATMGGLVAANVNAPLQMRYGALRDLVLCATVALADGRVIRTGRPIVKNVAGYDLTKAFVGSYGTLGVLTDISFKISSKPRVRRSLLIPINDLRYGLIQARQMLPIALTASAIVLSKGYTVDGLPHSNYLLTYTAEGIEQDVRAELAQVRQVLETGGDGATQTISTTQVFEDEKITGTDIWAALLSEQASIKVRIGVPSRELPAYIQDQATLLNSGAFIADISSGLLYATTTVDSQEKVGVWLETLRKIALATEGYALVMEMREQLQLDRWGYRPSSFDIMKQLKAQWDPRGILNAGAFLPDL